jgi:hypothetical protein
MCAQRPTATGASHSRARYDAWPARARCDESEDRAEWRPRRSRDPRAHIPAAVAVAPFAMQRGIASTNARASCESFRFAPVRRTANGTPRPSQIRWRLLPRLARSVGFGPVWSPQYAARMQLLSTTARDRSIWSSRASQSRSAKWIRSHTPACCQSRKRRQHVIPDAHPSSCGSICQGIPLRRTKTMPVRHARPETRGRPLCGRRGGIGKSGSIRSTADLEAARRPFLFTLPRRRGRRFGSFVTRSYVYYHHRGIYNGLRDSGNIFAGDGVAYNAH